MCIPEAGDGVGVDCCLEEARSWAGVRADLRRADQPSEIDSEIDPEIDPDIDPEIPSSVRR